MSVTYRSHQIGHVDDHQRDVEENEEEPQKGDHVGGEP